MCRTQGQPVFFDVWAIYLAPFNMRGFQPDGDIPQSEI